MNENPPEDRKTPKIAFQENGKYKKSENDQNLTTALLQPYPERGALVRRLDLRNLFRVLINPPAIGIAPKIIFGRKSRKFLYSIII